MQAKFFNGLCCDTSSIHPKVQVISLLQIDLLSLKAVSVMFLPKAMEDQSLRLACHKEEFMSAQLTCWCPLNGHINTLAEVQLLFPSPLLSMRIGSRHDNSARLLWTLATVSTLCSAEWETLSTCLQNQHLASSNSVTWQVWALPWLSKTGTHCTCAQRYLLVSELLFWNVALWKGVSFFLTTDIHRASSIWEMHTYKNGKNLC